MAETSSRLASLARSALTGRAFLASSVFASGDLLLDLLSLDLVFVALRYQPGFGPLAALISIPVAGALQVVARELWQATAWPGPPDGEPPAGPEAPVGDKMA